jgi:PEP-CTERM motif
MIGPLTQNGSRLSLPDTPVTTPTSVLHAFDMLYDNAGFASIFVVATELNDPTDVAVDITLARVVPDIPEPGTWTLFGIGLALVALAPRARSRARH